MPQFHALAELNVPKILENTLGIFSTRLVETDLSKKIENTEEANESANGKLELKKNNEKIKSHDFNN